MFWGNGDALKSFDSQVKCPISSRFGRKDLVPQFCPHLWEILTKVQIPFKNMAGWKIQHFWMVSTKKNGEIFQPAMWVYRRVDFSNPNLSFYILCFLVGELDFLTPARIFAECADVWPSERTSGLVILPIVRLVLASGIAKPRTVSLLWCKKNISSLPSLKMDWKKIVSLTSHPLINPKMDSKCTDQVHLATSSTKPEVAFSTCDPKNPYTPEN